MSEKFLTTFTANGVTIGGAYSDPFDHIHLEDYQGLGTTAVRLPNRPLARESGDFDLKSFNSGRVITVEAFVLADTRDGASEKFAEVKTAFGNLGIDGREAEEVLIGALGFYPTLRVLAKTAGEIPRTDPWQWDGWRIDFQVSLYCPDHRLYAQTEDSDNISPFAPAEGLDYPVTYPKIYGAGGTGSGTVLTIGGDTATWPMLEISGPSSGTGTDPILENVTNGKRLALTNNGGVSIASGQTLIIETRPGIRSIAFATGADRYGKLSDDSEFWELSPGNNEIRFRLNGSTSGALLAVRRRNAYR